MTDNPSPATEPPRCRLPKDRLSHTHKFEIIEPDETLDDTIGYVTVGMYDDGVVGDLFVYIAKEGTTLSGVLRAWSISVSLGLQYGIPLTVFSEKFRHMSFEPGGWTKTKNIPKAKSIIDYIFAMFERDFPEGRATDAVLERARRVGSRGNPQWEGKV